MSSPDTLRTAGQAALVAGAIGTLGLFLRAGRHTPPALLIMMAIWVFSPFAALEAARRISARWPAVVHIALYSMMIVVAVGSLAIYGADAIWPRKAQPAYMYVIVPPVCWFVTGAVLAIAAVLDKRRE